MGFGVLDLGVGVAINFSGLGFRVWVSNFWFTPFWIEVEFLRLGLEFLISGLFLFGLGWDFCV